MPDSGSERCDSLEASHVDSPSPPLRCGLPAGHSGLHQYGTATRHCASCTVEEVGAEQEFCAWCEPLETAKRERDEALDILRALMPYGDHRWHCHVKVGQHRAGCNCGWERLQARYDAMLERQNVDDPAMHTTNLKGRVDD